MICLRYSRSICESEEVWFERSLIGDGPRVEGVLEAQLIRDIKVRLRLHLLRRRHDPLYIDSCK